MKEPILNAEAIAGELDSLNSKIANVSSADVIANNFTVHKNNKVVFASCYAGTYSASSGNMIYDSTSTQCRIPEGYRPIKDVRIIDPVTGKYVIIDTYGFLLIDPSITSASMRFSVCWITN